MTGEMSAEEADVRANEILVAGALWASLSGQDRVRCEPVMVDGQASNELYVWFDFMKSRYRIRVYLDPEEP
jgi:hypothetical protein